MPRSAKQQLTWVQVVVDAPLRDAVKLSDVVVAVPHPQFLSCCQRATHSEVDVSMMLKRRQVPVALLRRGPDKPAGPKHQSIRAESDETLGVYPSRISDLHRLRFYTIRAQFDGKHYLIQLALVSSLPSMD